MLRDVLSLGVKLDFTVLELLLSDASPQWSFDELLLLEL